MRGFNTICLACGTGTTLAGMTLSLNQNQKMIGFPVLKGGNFLQEDGIPGCVHTARQCGRVHSVAPE